MNIINTNKKERKPIVKHKIALQKHKEIVYNIYIGQSVPRFVLFTEGPEIMQRLILKALFTNSFDELHVKKSLV